MHTILAGICALRMQHDSKEIKHATVKLHARMLVMILQKEIVVKTTAL